jgi:hypothetical protein
VETPVFVEGLVGLQAVVELAEEFVEQMPLGLVVPVPGGAAGTELRAPGEPRSDARAQMEPAAARRRFFIRRSANVVRGHHHTD